LAEVHFDYGNVPARYDGLPNPQTFFMSRFILKQGCDVPIIFPLTF